MRCEWLVPGLLPEKVAELIRGLPKSLRRNFVPAPDFARAFAAAEAPRDDALNAALATYLKRVTGIEISSRDFDGIEIPAHLHMRNSQRRVLGDEDLPDRVSLPRGDPDPARILLEVLEGVQL